MDLHDIGQRLNRSLANSHLGGHPIRHADTKPNPKSDQHTHCNSHVNGDTRCRPWQLAQSWPTAKPD